MRGTEAKRSWAFLLTVLLAIGAAAAILPGCADDDSDHFDSCPPGRICDDKIDQ